MTVRRLPERPNLDQLKHQAKDLLAAWHSGATVEGTPERGALRDERRLRDAQKALAQEYGFESWDALRTHVEALVGALPVARRTRKDVLEYDDPIPNVVELNEPLTPDVVRRLIDQKVTARKVSPRAAAATLKMLAEIPTLTGIDLGNRGEMRDSHLRFLEAMPWLTALSLSRCGQVTDTAIERLRNNQHLE